MSHILVAGLINIETTLHIHGFPLLYPPATLSTNAETAYLYTGQQYDAATAMYSLRARYYAPGAGQPFMDARTGDAGLNAHGRRITSGRASRH
jgi:RHS repeat-associated protein